MSASPEFVAYVREQLAALGPLADGKFFGGHAFKHGGTQFAMVMGNTLYFCVNDQTRSKYEQAGSEAFSYATKNGRVQVRKYFSAPAELFEDSAELLRWTNEAIAAAKGAR
ncbi:DNA transformation protein [Andreprevotia lacus DSM 23236]|jgi:DNA transformation protein|uniref:DNA transformation protein n=1 Tax=Andreprevotia lacus DSM 23236 TaxID=1121001 RepID=A0A1W1Y119_9NEIS|nr:TfoX/Sxy family protein [Andreprevotia lacus]SMC29835.1 DNA transformation protein [Andreprevotia lacus DSM 23236]